MAKIQLIKISREQSRDRKTGILRRPIIIEEVVLIWEYFCEGCEEWFEPERPNQRYHGRSCRNKVFRQNRKTELETLRRRVKR